MYGCLKVESFLVIKKKLSFVPKNK